MSMFFGNRLNRILRDEKKEGGDGGGGAGGGEKTASDPAKEMSDLKASNAALLERLDKLEKASKPPAEDPGLEAKARLEREAKDKKDAESKSLEAALRFSLGAKDWLKTNSSLLPKDAQGIFDVAEKEKYGSAMEKDAAIKSALMQEFFKVQSNLDLLTPSLKTGLEDWLKLTKNGKEEKSQQVYDSIFEPTFEMLKRIKKAEQLRMGTATPTDDENAYKQMLMKRSRQHYTGEKDDGAGRN